MAISKYNSGRRKEYELKKILEDEGYGVIRAAGSKGVFDLVAYNGNGIRFIQVKYASTKTSYRLEIEKIKSTALPHCATKELWVYTKGDGWKCIMNTSHTLLNELPE